MSILIVRRGIQGPRGLSGLAARETLSVAANMAAIIAVSENLDIIANAPIDAAHITYDNSTSNLVSYTAQQALDELAINISTLSPIVVGQVITGLWSTAPDGYLALEGQTGLSRTTYSELFNHLNGLGLIVTEAGKAATQFGDGNGTTTFSMADWRSQFFRGVGGVRALGSYQADAFKLHSHPVNDPSHAHGHIVVPQSSDDDSLNPGPNVVTNTLAGGVRDISTGYVGSATTGVTVTATGDTETRPQNIAVMYCIATGENTAYYVPPGDPVYLDVTVSADYTVEDYVNTVYVDTSADVEITLGTPTRYKELWIKDTTGDAASHNITVIGDIDGGSSYVIGTGYGSVTLKGDGTKWSIKA